MRQLCRKSTSRLITSLLGLRPSASPDLRLTSSTAVSAAKRTITDVAADPECGDVIRGTGGFRKVRVARKGMGKSGGARIVYIWRNERFPVSLIAVFPKNEKENLSIAERNTLRKRADSIFETYGR